MVYYSKRSKSVINQRSNSYPITRLKRNDEMCEKSDTLEQNQISRLYADINFSSSTRIDPSFASKDSNPKTGLSEMDNIQNYLLDAKNHGNSRNDIPSTSISFGPLAVVKKASCVNEAEYRYINHQLHEKMKLDREIQRLKGRINLLRNDVSELTKGLLNQAKRIAEEVDRSELIKRDVEKLRDEITQLVNEMDPDNSSASSGHSESISMSVNFDMFDTLEEKFGSSSCGYDDEQWKCGACTFLNHNALAYCELCHFPRSKIKSTCMQYDGMLTHPTFVCYCCRSSRRST